MPMLFAAVTPVAEGLRETLLALKVEKSLICLVGTRRLNSIHNRTASFVPEKR
jgi:hypothetical protein